MSILKKLYLRVLEVKAATMRPEVDEVGRVRDRRVDRVDGVALQAKLITESARCGAPHLYI